MDNDTARVVLEAVILRYLDTIIARTRCHWMRLNQLSVEQIAIHISPHCVQRKRHSNKYQGRMLE